MTHTPAPPSEPIHPLLKRRYTIDLTTAILAGLFALIVAAPVGILMGLVFGGVGS